MTRGAINRFRNWLARCIETPGRWTTDVPSRTYEVQGRRPDPVDAADPTAIHLHPRAPALAPHRPTCRGLASSAPPAAEGSREQARSSS
jgi:hypothetical protein